MDKKFRVPFPPTSNPTKPKWKLPPGSWDTHFHAYGPPQIFPYSEDRFFTPCAAPIEHYFALSAFLGLERGIIVQSSVHGDHDTRVTLHAIAKSEGRLRGVVRANPEYDERDIGRLHAAGIRGMRVTLARNLNGHFDDAYFKRIVSLCSIKSWVVALHLDTRSIVELADVIRRVPLQTIIENYAQIDARLGVDQPALRTMVDLAQEPHIWLKTASACNMLRRGATYNEIIPVARTVAESSPDRVIWGSDWPHSQIYELGQMPNDGELLDWLIDFVPDESKRRKMLVDNPKRLFDFD